MERSLRGQKTICIPIASEAAYGEIVEDSAQFQEYLDETIQLHRELFPPQIQDGYRFYGMSYSQKQNLKLRRIQLLRNGEVYQLRPDFMMPYMIGQTDAAPESAVSETIWSSLHSPSVCFWAGCNVLVSGRASPGKIFTSGDNRESPKADAS